MHFWRKTSQLRDMVLPYCSWFLHVQARERVGDDTTSTEIGAAGAHWVLYSTTFNCGLADTCRLTLSGECATVLVLPYFRTVR